MANAVSLDEALTLIAEGARATGVERISTRAALSRVLARELKAASALPPFDQSTVDGYAMLPGTASPTPVSSRIYAGEEGPLAIGPGECVYVATGGRVPAGCGVLMQEEVTADGGTITFARAPAAGDNVRREGEEIRAGDGLAAAGERVTPGLQALLLALAIDAVDVKAAPRVLVVSTGTELREDGPLTGSAIRNTNGPYLAAELSGLGAAPERVSVPDDVDVFRAEMASRLPALDLIVSTGGISVGPKDHVAEVAEAFGFAPLFRGLTLRPGRPLSAFRRADGVLWIALPGNPLATALGHDLLVRPAVARLLGQPFAHPWMRLTLASDLPGHRSPIDRYWPCSLGLAEGRLVLQPAPYAPSGAVRPFAALKAWARLPGGADTPRRGEEVDALVRLDGLA